MGTPHIISCDKCGASVFVLGTGNCNNCGRAFASHRASSKSKKTALKKEREFTKKKQKTSKCNCGYC
jgi:ribosomal protein L37E